MPLKKNLGNSNPSYFGLPNDYIFTETEWGSVFYKLYGKTNFDNANALCQNDGASLPIPRSGTDSFS